MQNRLKVPRAMTAEKKNISGLVDGRGPALSEKYIGLKQPYCLNKVHWSVKIS